jgi:hypothetical protein
MLTIKLTSPPVPSHPAPEPEPQTEPEPAPEPSSSLLPAHLAPLLPPTAPPCGRERCKFATPAPVVAYYFSPPLTAPHRAPASLDVSLYLRCSTMNMQQERAPPPAYTQHEPESLHLPSVPTHSLSSPPANDRLPGIRSLDLPDASPRTRTHFQRSSIELSPKAHAEPLQWASLPPLNAATYPSVPEGVPRSSAERDIGSPMDTASIASAGDDYARRREMSVVSMDDPDVRLAAEALSGLGNLGG